MFVAIGKITVPTAGVPVSLISRLSPQQARKIQATADLAPAFGVSLQTYYTNTGKIWIGDADLSKSTGVGVAHILLAPTSTFAASWSVALPVAHNGLSLAGLYLDADTSTEAVLLGLLVG